MTDTAEVVEAAVREERGQSFTDLKEKTGLCNGVLQYHIRKNDELLSRNGAIHYRGCCETCPFREDCEDRCIQKELRKTRTREILKMMRDGMIQADIARELDLSRATVNYHVDKLREMNLIES
ncbi:MAG: helix-turn-helix domain-containing protein [Candidatus Nanohalobium sp.]